MEEDEKPAASAFFRHRSPTFSKEEVKALLNIVEKHKTVVLNRSTSAAASHAKETAWIKIAKTFNRQGFTHLRTPDCLKIKWDNLKKEARKLSKNLMDVKYGDDDVTNQVIVMMCEVANNSSIVEETAEYDEELNEAEQEKEITNEVLWDEAEKDSDETLDGEENGRLMNRSLNFTPRECNLLLQCVRREKNIILSKANTSSANKIKTRAWTRVTNSYNKLSPQKRSTKVLRTKFTNMKRLAKNVSIKDYFKDFRKKHDKLEDGSKPSKDIKAEPIFDYYHSITDADEADNLYDADVEPNNHISSPMDPLRSVLNSDFSTGCTTNIESKEIVKLKTDLLHFKLETAKLERKRIEDLMEADAANRESQAMETSLRLRAARLEAVAAEMKLSPSHPALAYTVEEARAQQYIHHCHAS